MERIKLLLGSLIFAACSADAPMPPRGTPNATVATSAVSVKSDGGAVAANGTAATASPVGTQTQVLRHLPETAVRLAGDATVYLVQSDGSLAPFASATALHTSGYSDAMVVAASSAELSCYGAGKTIKSGLPAPAGGHLRDGTLVKENNKSDVYAVSDGVAWPIVNFDVFTAAGYKTESVKVIAAGTLAGVVDEIGDCVLGIACLDADYLGTCAKDDLGDVSVDPGSDDDTATVTITATATASSSGATTVVATSVQTATATQTATQSATSAATASRTAAETQTQTSVQTQTAAQSATSVATAAQTQATTYSPTAAATQTQTSSATAVSVASAITATQTATSTQTATQTAAAAAAPATWVWTGDGTKICLNATYFLPRSAGRAVLRTWSGPYVTGLNAGPVADKDGQNRFCWDFDGMQSGIYALWADAPAASCANADFCGDDGVTGDGAQYGTAPNATALERKWLKCADTGCDGYAVFNGTAWLPANP
jgi:hypothetical protein